MRLTDREIHAYLRSSVRSREREQIGPFLATFSPHSDNPFLNYAIPDDDANPSPDDVTALIAAYRRRGRKPRLEYLPGAAPNVEGALLAGGFTVEGRLPLMTCMAGQERDVPAPPGIELLVATEEPELFAALAVQDEAYGEPGPLTPAEMERVRGSVEAGSIYVLARDAATGEPAGAGLCAIPHGGIAEIAAIGVRPAFRRRGIAAALAARLAREASAAGVTRPFLMAEGAAEERIHARAGFVTTSEMLHISY